MNRVGRPKRRVIGGVDAAIGAIAASSSSRVVSGAMGPIPDEPATVTCGA